MARGLGEFEQLLLFAVLRLENDAYGVRIRQEIEERTGRDVYAGAVYTGLDRLQKRGYVMAREERGDEVRRGRPRKYYRLLPEGAAALEASFDNVKAMAKGVTRELGRLAAERTADGAGA